MAHREILEGQLPPPGKVWWLPDDPPCPLCTRRLDLRTEIEYACFWCQARFPATKFAKPISRVRKGPEPYPVEYDQAKEEWAPPGEWRSYSTVVKPCTSIGKVHVIYLTTTGIFWQAGPGYYEDMKAVGLRPNAIHCRECYSGYNL